MADHLREQIMDALVTKLTGLTTTGTNVSRFRLYPHDAADQPSLNVVQGNDTPVNDLDDESVLLKVYRVLTVYVDLRVKQNTTIDQTLNLMDAEVTVALMADHTQGVAGVINTIEGDTFEPEGDGTADQPVALMRKQFEIHYQTSRSDPTVVL